MRHQRNRAKVAVVFRAVHVRGYRPFEIRHAVVRERLAPNVEEHAERVRDRRRALELRGFDVDDAAGVVRVNPVQAALRRSALARPKPMNRGICNLLAVDRRARDAGGYAGLRIPCARHGMPSTGRPMPPWAASGSSSLKCWAPMLRAVGERDRLSRIAIRARASASPYACDASFGFGASSSAEDHDHQRDRDADADVNERHRVAMRRRSGATALVAAAVGTSRL